MPRKSITAMAAMRRTMRNRTEGQGAGTLRASSSGPGMIPGGGQLERPLVPTKARHVEVALAMVLWLCFFPAMYFIGDMPLNVILVLLVITLMIHAYTMRPFCTEFDEEEEEEMIEMLNEGSMGNKEAMPSSRGSTNKDVLEEWRLLGLMVTIVCILICAICLAMGGLEALATWIAPVADGCSVSDLGRLNSGHGGFSCKDGIVDLSQERSFIAKRTSVHGSTAVMFRLAPVYAEAPRKGKSLPAAPVAWSVSKNYQLLERPCGEHGLCGLFAAKYCSTSDLQSYRELVKATSADMIGANAKNLEDAGLPLVFVTNLADPEGKAVICYIGCFCYVVVLIALGCYQRAIYAEGQSKLDNVGSLLFSGYEQLEEVGSVPVVRETSQ